MDKHIKREAAIAIIEEKQKELCPVGRYGRGYVYGSDREKYDAWDEIIDALENIPAAEVAPVVHGRWVTHYRSGTPVAEGYVSTCCDMWNNRKSDYCPNCGAKMDGERKDGGDG